MTLIIFDIDGTLLYSNGVDSVTFAQAYLELFGQEIPTIDWSYYPHCTDTSIVDTLFKEHFQRAPLVHEIENLKKHYVALMRVKREEDASAYKAVPGAQSIFKRLLADERFILGIATGGWALPAEEKLNFLNFPLEPVYKAYADGNVAREAILEESISKARAAGHSFERVVYIGDAKWDVQTTRNMQIPFVGIRVKGDRETLLELGSHEVLVDYRDEEAFLEAVFNAQVPKEGPT